MQIRNDKYHHYFHPHHTQSTNAEFQASVNVTAPLAERIMSQLHEPPDKAEITLLQQKAKKEKAERLLKQSEEWRNSLPARTKSCQLSEREGSIKLVISNSQ